MKFSKCCKRILEADNLANANKTEYITSQKPGSHKLWWTADSGLNKSKTAIFLPFNKPKVLFSASEKAKVFVKTFSKNLNLDD